MLPIQIGWKAGPEQFGPRELLDYAVAADRAGFASLDVSDHFHPWAEAGQAAFAWTWLGAAAARTERIRLGPGVTCPILRYHPAVIAQAAGTLGVMAPGRAYLAVGTGESLNEYAATGTWPGYTERQDRLREAIELIRALWSGESVSYRGAFYETDKARLYTRPDKPIPLYISAMVPGSSASFAGEVGDGLWSVGGNPPEVYKQLIAKFEEGARRAGKDPSAMPRAIELNVVFDDDQEAGIQAMRKFWAGAFIPALYDQKIYTPALSEQNGQVVGADTVRQKCCVSADPKRQAEYVRQHIDLGFNEVYIHSASLDQARFIERYAREVLPLLGQRTGDLVGV